MELKSAISSVFLHAGKHLKASTNQRRQPVPLLLTGNREGDPVMDPPYPTSLLMRTSFNSKFKSLTYPGQNTFLKVIRFAITAILIVDFKIFKIIIRQK